MQLLKVKEKGCEFWVRYFMQDGGGVTIAVKVIPQLRPFVGAVLEKLQGRSTFLHPIGFERVNFETYQWTETQRSMTTYAVCTRKETCESSLRIGYRPV